MQMKKSFAGPVVALALLFSTSSAPAEATFTILGPFPIITATYGVGAVPIIPPTTNSPAPWVFTSSNSKVATISGMTIRIVGAGTSTITASQAAMGVFTPRARSTQIRVAQGTPVLGKFAPQSILITQQTYALVPPTTTSDGYWSFTSSNPNIASVVGSTVTFHAGGLVLIFASQSSTPNWKAANTLMRLTVQLVTPVLGNFGDVTVMKDSVSSLSLNPPKSTSPGSWTFTSSNPTVATVSSTTITPLAFGTTVITATQAAIGDFAVSTASMTLTVQGPIPTLGAFADVTAKIATAPYVVIAPPTSTSTGTWSFTSSDPAIAVTSGAVVTLYKPGVVTITANQASTATFASPVPVNMKLTVVGDAQIGSWVDLQKAIGDPDSAITPPTSTSPGSWSYTSSNPQIVDVVDGIVKVKAVGGVTISAIQNATPTFTQGSAHMTIFVFGARPTIGTFAPIVATEGDPAIELKAPTSNSTGAWTFTASDSKVASVHGSSLNIVGVGTATISAIQGPSGLYSQSNMVQTTLTVKPKPTPSPTPTPKPSATPTPTPTIRPTATPTPTLKPSPTPTPGVNQTVNVTASGRVINVVAVGVKALVWINGKPAKVGKNTVKPGLAAVVITINDRVVYRRNFTIK